MAEYKDLNSFPVTKTAKSQLLLKDYQQKRLESSKNIFYLQIQRRRYNETVVEVHL